MTICMAGCFQWGRKEQKDIKLVITGLDDAGKSTTLACLQGEPPDGIAPTVGFANAKISVGRWNVVIFDLGGGNTVRSVWGKYYAEVYGIIFAVDSANCARLEECRKVLAEMFSDQRVKGKPLLVLANKQDKEDSLSEAEITEKLTLAELSTKHDFKFKVFSCSAIKGYGKAIDKRIRSGVEWLLSSINENFESIHEKVATESELQREQETKERKERMERIRKIREEREKAAKEAGIAEEEDEEDDGDVVTSNPFRNINDQIKVTEKREKKAKENDAKIQSYQSNKKKDIEPPKLMKSKKMKEMYKADDNDGSEDNNVVNDKIISVSDLNYAVSSSTNSTPHKVIFVGSKDDLREEGSSNIIEKEPENGDITNNIQEGKISNKKKKSIKTAFVDQSEVVTSPTPKEGSSVVTSPTPKGSMSLQNEREINNSRAELFMARSTESMSKISDGSLCNSNEKKAKKKKSKKVKRSEVVELRSGEEEGLDEVEHKLRKENEFDNYASFGKLPPLKSVSQLEPIELKGRLPKYLEEKD